MYAIKSWFMSGMWKPVAPGGVPLPAIPIEHYLFRTFPISGTLLRRARTQITVTSTLLINAVKHIAISSILLRRARQIISVGGTLLRKAIRRIGLDGLNLDAVNRVLEHMAAMDAEDETDNLLLLYLQSFKEFLRKRKQRQLK